MLIKLSLLLVFVGTTLGGTSPNGEKVAAALDGRLANDDIIEDARLDVVGLLQKYGYPSETHVVETEDGYLLTVHRITGSKRSPPKEGKPVVFLMHGLLMSSADWITSGPNDAFGYQLADEGFDVWMGNARGNYYSRNHVSIKPSQSKFWKFSWNEIGLYDLPAMINYVLAKTGQDKLHYAGHSQGTTSFFVMASLRPEYNNKIKSMHAMAPVAYMPNLLSPLVRLLAPMANTMETLTSFIGMNEFLPNNHLMTIAGDLLCKDNSIFQPVCTNFLFLLCGFNPDLFNATMLPVYMGHTPAGASSRQFIHYAQEHRSGKFRKYDFGPLNIFEYGSLTPPKYPLNKVTAPVALHYSDNDWMAHPEDVHQLFTELANPIGKFRVAHPKFNHLDYMWAINARSLIYNRIINLMRAFN